MTISPTTTIESTLQVFDKPYHNIKENLPHWEELENLRTYALHR